ncbi:uncharacterized protein B0H18DRAFT_1122731 [Fomitopsis serialis]|uniref:uncharacterized protein n=1 Tax=Fomitopsis serialis TaxID=139415 RepID=UPI002008A3F9|nr:uncharacterized protein B0H18DRAFT_1122731 [Neoantrodia serialis]KAH9919034.1 hypothetical protein B0H18DRAFT_1122731 [Neoantrodia serialis]
MLPYAHPNISLDVVEEIFKHLSPYALSEHDPGFKLLDAQGTPAVEVLWREQDLIHACGVLPSFALASVRGPMIDADQYPQDNDANDDWPEDGRNPHARNCLRPSTYYHLSGPISSEEWSRFQYYAHFIRSLYHDSSERLESTAFFYLRQHAHDTGNPLFPNLHKLEWGHVTPDLAMVISPSIRVLRIPERSSSHEDELDYRMRRHAFKTQLPSVLRSLPNVETLELLRLGHEGFWHTFAPGPDHQFVAQNISVLHISEPYSALMKGALAAVSTIQALTQLRIDVVLTSCSGDDGELKGWDKTRIRTFARLRCLQIKANMGQSGVLLDAIVAPNLEDVEVKRDCESGPCKVPFSLPEALEPLGNRNVSSLRRVYLDLQNYYIPKPGDEPETEPIFLTLTKPLLQLRQLRELNIYIYPGADSSGPIDVALPAMLAAWPLLEHTKQRFLTDPHPTADAQSRGIPSHESTAADASACTMRIVQPT